MANVEQFLLRYQRDEAQSIELFLAKPEVAERCGAVLFVHGHQGSQRIGAREMVDNWALSLCFIAQDYSSFYIPARLWRV
jgi:hypothetical protein